MNITTPSHFISLGTSLTVGSILGQVQDGIEEVIDLAFDRLDRSLLVAAERLQGLITTLTADLHGLMDATIDELDEEKRKLLDDLQGFARVLNLSAEDRLAQIDQMSTAVASTVQELLTDTPGFLDLFPAIAIAGDDTAEFRIRGINVNRIEMTDARLAGQPVTPEILEKDGDGMRFQIAIPDQLRQASGDDVRSVKLSFSIREDGFWPWSHKLGRPFATTLHIFPEVVGEVTAVWSGKITTRETRMLTRTQKYSRLKSGWAGGSKRRVHNHEERPDDGWVFDFNKAKLEFWSSGGCSNRRSTAKWRVRQPKLVAADVFQITESGPSIGCYVRSTISVPMYREPKVDKSFATLAAPISMGQRIALTPPEDATNATDLQLSHVEIRSGVFGTSDTTLILPGETIGGLMLEVDHSSNTAFVSARFV